MQWETHWLGKQVSTQDHKALNLIATSTCIQSTNPVTEEAPRGTRGLPAKPTATSHQTDADTLRKPWCVVGASSKGAPSEIVTGSNFWYSNRDHYWMPVCQLAPIWCGPGGQNWGVVIWNHLYSGTSNLCTDLSPLLLQEQNTMLLVGISWLKRHCWPTWCNMILFSF